MHPLFNQAAGITHDVIGGVIELHKDDIPLGLIIDFHVLKLSDGVSRLILPGANLQ